MHWKKKKQTDVLAALLLAMKIKIKSQDTQYVVSVNFWEDLVNVKADKNLKFKF